VVLEVAPLLQARERRFAFAVSLQSFYFGHGTSVPRGIAHLIGGGRIAPDVFYGRPSIPG
jgi:hypothetical protein